MLFDWRSPVENEVMLKVWVQLNPNHSEDTTQENAYSRFYSAKGKSFFFFFRY